MSLLSIFRRALFGELVRINLKKHADYFSAHNRKCVIHLKQGVWIVGEMEAMEEGVITVRI